MEPSDLQRDGYSISTAPTRLDVDAVHAYLTRSYWAGGIPKDLVARAIRGSLCFGLFHGDEQVGFTRVITDGAPLARPETLMEIVRPDLYRADIYPTEPADKR